MRTLAIAALAIILGVLTIGGLGALSAAQPAGAEQVATINMASFDNGRVQFQYDYNLGNKKVTVVRCINNGDYSARATVIDPTDNSVVLQLTFEPGTTWQRNIAGQQVYIDANGEPNFPYIIRADYPAP